MGKRGAALQEDVYPPVISAARRPRAETLRLCFWTLWLLHVSAFFFFFYVYLFNWLFVFHLVALCKTVATTETVCPHLCVGGRSVFAV